jgi:hypothetical protein
MDTDLDRLRFLLAAVKETDIPPATERRPLAEFRGQGQLRDAAEADRGIGGVPQLFLVVTAKTRLHRRSTFFSPQSGHFTFSRSYPLIETTISNSLLQSKHRNS